MCEARVNSEVAPAPLAPVPQAPGLQDLTLNPLSTAGVLEYGHADELQRALAAAAAWRNELQPVNMAVVRSSGPEPAVSVAQASPAVVATEDLELATGADDASYMAELQAALDAAASWRTKLQHKNGKSDAVEPSEPEAVEAPCVKQSLSIETASTTASGADSNCGESSDGGDGLQSCWVCAVLLKDVRKILEEGLWGSQRRIRIYAGPWGRTGLARRGEDVLVYIDAARALASGAELRFRSNGLLLAKGSVIPATCLRKVVRIRDAEVLYENLTSAEDLRGEMRVRGAPRPAPETQAIASKATSGSPLAALLRDLK